VRVSFIHPLGGLAYCNRRKVSCNKAPHAMRARGF
jgi:hypothetical protein